MSTAKQLHVATNRIGWEALQHKDGWWVGTADGVTCYGDHQLAQMALTIVWRREGGRRRQCDYRIRTFTEQDLHKAGEHTPEFGSEEAMRAYEEEAEGKASWRV